VEFEDVAPDELRDFVLRLQDSVTVGEILDERYVAQQVVATTSLPTLVSGGVAWSPVERLRLTGDLQWFGWEEAGSIGLDFVDDSLDDRLTFDYDDDTWSIRTGVEVRHRPGQVVRLGFAHVESPTSRRSLTPVLPDSDRDEISAGVGLVWRGVQLDLAYRIAFLSDREGVALPGDPSPDGVYESTEQALAVGIARRF
ncbi:MAG: outer membrane protein transport protein, partial [Gemmatimonadota bacterium]|nr:outer membrane protein transport protein [Gemmatimonadota bacterium]